MNEEQNIEESQKDSVSERPKEVNEIISLKETIEQNEISEPAITTSDIQNMEVYHHPKV